MMENAKCMSIREGNLVGVYTNKLDGGAKFIMPKCISSTDKHGRDNSLLILVLAFAVYQQLVYL